MVNILSIQEIKSFIENDKNSKRKQQAKKGVDYYNGRHDILNYRMFYFNSDGILQEDRYRSNVKIPHPFFTELADQAVQYTLSGERFALSDNTELQAELDNYFNYNDSFTSNLTETLTGCIVKGFDYMYAYKDNDNKTAFMHADSMGVVEVRAKDTNDKCDYIIYHYIDRIEKHRKIITHIQVWDKSQVWYYIMADGTITIDENVKLNPAPHNLYDKGDGKTYYDNYGLIPFFRIDNNKRQMSDLVPIKPLIDDYDLMASSLSNNLADFDTPLYVVSGYDGDNLDELQQNLKTKKIIGLDKDGTVDIKTVDVPYIARQTKLELDEKNIYRFGMGLNTAGLKDTSATTNVAIKSAYSLLDLKCKKLEIKLKQFMRKILEVILDEINKTHQTGYKQSDVYFDFKHEILSNALENAQIEQIKANTKQYLINAVLSIEDKLDHETIIKQICDTMDIEYEDIKDKLPDKNEGENSIINAITSFETEEI